MAEESEEQQNYRWAMAKESGEASGGNGTSATTPNRSDVSNTALTARVDLLAVRHDHVDLRAKTARQNQPGETNRVARHSVAAAHMAWLLRRQIA